MRITNKIMQNNSLYNINNNKVSEDELNTQIATGKKINRPSDDPVIAIRGLRLRSTVTQLDQYYEKNASDAEKWLKVTEDALSTLSDVLTDAVKQATDGANKDLTLDDCETIITQIDALANEYYATGNVDYAGRFIFTGYRTNTPLTFADKESAVYTGINDEFNFDDVETATHVQNLFKVNAGDTNAGDAQDVLESTISQANVGRIHLSYENLSSEAAEDVSLKYRVAMAVPASTKVANRIDPATGDPLLDANGDPKKSVQISFTADQGGSQTDISFEELPEKVGETKENSGYTITMNSDYTYTVRQTSPSAENSPVMELNKNGSIYASYLETTLTPAGVLTEDSTDQEVDDAYAALDYTAHPESDEPDPKYYVNAVTGEVIMNEALTNKLTALTNIDNANTIDVVYNKNEWTNGDLRPENLFECTFQGDDLTTEEDNIHYNGGNAAHTMEYDVGYNQSVRVNTTGQEVFTTDVKRSADDLKELLAKMKDLDNSMSAMKRNLALTNDEETQKHIQDEINAAAKAYDYLREDMQVQFGHKITSFQKALDVANVATTENGTRSKRLSMIQTRLMNQRTTFKTLQSENEDTDLAETATNLSTAERTYQASLMATGKIMQHSLMDYI